MISCHAILRRRPVAREAIKAWRITVLNEKEVLTNGCESCVSGLKANFQMLITILFELLHVMD